MSQPANQKQYSHYYKAVPLERKSDGTIGPATHIDIYNVIEMWEVFQPALGHALKKIVCAGTRGAKSYVKDVQEVIDCCKRELELFEQRMLFEPMALPTAVKDPLTELVKETEKQGLYETYRCTEIVPDDDSIAEMLINCNKVLPCPIHNFLT